MAKTCGDEVITCRRVVKRFGAVTALDELDLAVRRGEVLGYLGPNGAGKSTTIRLLVDLARPDAGELRVLGLDPRARPDLRRRIGYLPGELRLDDRLRVDDTLRSGARVRGGVDEGYLRSLCERLSLDTDRETKGLSSGNRRKVGLVGAFMARPELLVLDEPTAGVDPLVQAVVLDLVEEARDEGRTVFLSSHVLTEVQRVADRIVILRAGRTVASGSLDELRKDAWQPFTAWFTGPVPETALRCVPGLRHLEVHGNEARGVIQGDPNGLLAVLAANRLDHLVLPELDLEQAFLRYYEEVAAS
jgi:ABC-2 type transport system ATP-binding protein